MQSVADGLRALEARGTNLETLVSSEEFVSTLLAATNSALRTSREEKRRWLRNAVLNVATVSEADEDIQQIFLGYIDGFSTLHVSLLLAYETPADFIPPKMFGQLMGQLQDGGVGLNWRVYREAAIAAVPGIGAFEDLYAVIEDDLTNRRLAHTTDEVQKSSPLGFAPTELGSRFLHFIRAPFVA